MNNEFERMLKDVTSLVSAEPMLPVKTNQSDLDGLLRMVGAVLGPDCQFFMGDYKTVLNHLFKDSKKVTYADEIKFSYYGKTGFTNGHKGIIVIASVVDEDKGVVYYGIAFCSPEDSYDKAIGKEIAYHDLVENMTSIHLRKKSHHAVNAGIFCDLIVSGYYPSWAKKMVAKWAVKHVKAGMLPKKKDKIDKLLEGM